jgi:uncharacterized protein YndB with AHSA1/START domain
MSDTTNTITVETTVKTPVAKVWELWTIAEHIKEWNNASDDWHTPSATNDLRVGGSFVYTMAAKDGSFSFDFGGVYDEVDLHKSIGYKLGDNRKVYITFGSDGDETTIRESFEAETTNPIELQRGGWQAILNNFKKYAESV